MKPEKYGVLIERNGNDTFRIIENGNGNSRIRIPLFRIDEHLFIATMGGEPCYNVKKIVREVFAGKELCFVGYTDACAYIVDDVMISEGGYEPTSSLEYGLKGNFKPGISQKIREGFASALKQSLP